eukprot:gene16255-16434_t
MVRETYPHGTIAERQILFTGLYKKAFPAVAKYVNKMGGNFDEAKDIFQDALVIYYEKIVKAPISNLDSEQAYLLGIAKHLWSRRFSRQILNKSLDEQIDQVDFPDEDNLQPAAERLMHYLETAGQKCMEMLKAFYYDNLPVSTIAQLFGFSGTRSATVQKYKCMEKLMRTSLTEIKLIDDYLFNCAAPGDAVLLDAMLLIDSELPEKISWQQQTHVVIKNYSRKMLKSEIKAVHRQLFNQPEHLGFKNYAVNHLRMGQTLVNHLVSQTSNAAINMGMTPYIMEERQLNISQMDVFSRLMMDRIIFLGTAIDDNVANIMQAQLLFLQSTDPKKDIQIYINSPGGSVYAGFGIYDTMQLISPDVATICTGMAASFASIILCAGAPGKRAALNHSRVMLHQPLGGVQGQASDIEITAKQIQIIKKELYEIYVKHCHQEYQNVHDVCDRDFWMRGEEAVAFGVIDEILGSVEK